LNLFLSGNEFEFFSAIVVNQDRVAVGLAVDVLEVEDVAGRKNSERD
jgi:hypothetical protein